MSQMWESCFFLFSIIKVYTTQKFSLDYSLVTAKQIDLFTPEALWKGKSKLEFDSMKILLKCNSHNVVFSYLIKQVMVKKKNYTITNVL